MATLPTPYTAVANTKPTAANHNTWRDSIQQLQGLAPTGGQGRVDFFVGRLTAAQTLTTAVQAALLLDTEEADSASGHSTVTNTSRYLMQTLGWHIVSLTVTFAANATGNRLLTVGVNGTGPAGRQVIQAPAGAANSTALTLTVPVQCTVVGDYVEILAQQTSGGNLNVTAALLHVRYLHP